LKNADLRSREKKNRNPWNQRSSLCVVRNTGLAVFARTDTACSVEGHLGARRLGALFGI
jgi:hypothetical protein